MQVARENATGITLTVVLEANDRVNDANQCITNGTEFVNIMTDVSNVLEFLIRSISCTCLPEFLLYRITDPGNENSLIDYSLVH